MELMGEVPRGRWGKDCRWRDCWDFI